MESLKFPDGFPNKGRVFRNDGFLQLKPEIAEFFLKIEGFLRVIDKFGGFRKDDKVGDALRPDMGRQDNPVGTGLNELALGRWVP